MDFIRELAFPLPATVIAGLMGAPEEDLEPIKTWSDRLAAYLGGAVDERDNFAEASTGIAGLVDYFRTLLRERARRPRDDLMSLMLRAEHEGDRLTHEVINLLNRTFVTPLDRDDMYRLATAIDDVCDHIDEAADNIDANRIWRLLLSKYVRFNRQTQTEANKGSNHGFHDSSLRV